MPRPATSEPALLAKHATEFRQAAQCLEDRCWRMLPEPQSQRARTQILAARRRLDRYVQESEAGTHPCPEAEVQARMYRISLASAAEICAAGLNAIQQQTGRLPDEEQISLARDVTAWACRKVPTFPDNLNQDQLQLVSAP